VFAPASGAHKRPRIEAIHDAPKHQPARKRICLGGGRVSGRSRENLISSLLPQVNIVEQSAPVPHLPNSAPREIHPPLDFTNLGYIPHGGPNTPQSYTEQFTPRGPVTLTEEQAVRRYSEIHADTVAAHARWVAETEEATQRWAGSLPDTPQAIVSGRGASQTAGSQEVIAPTQVAIHLELIAPTQGAHVAIGQEVTPAPGSAAPDDDTSSRAAQPPPSVRASQRHLPPSFRRPGATVDPAIVRRYAEMRAETDAQVRAFRLRHPPVFYMPDAPRATPQEPQPMQSVVATNGPGAEPSITQEVVTPPPSTAQVVASPSSASQVVASPSFAAQVVASPSTAAQVVAPPSSTAHPATSQPIHAFTRPITSMLQSFAFEDTRSGYYDDYEVDYPQI